MVADSVLDAIGGTPLVRMRRVMPACGFQLFAKLESSNPGGSGKDRPAAGMLRTALASGAIGAGTTIIESSSGNMAIGLAQACASLGLQLICVVDAKTTDQHVQMLTAYGASVDLVRTPDPATGEFLPARLARVQELLAADPNAFWTNQYANPGNARAQQTVLHEIMHDLGRPVDVLCCATSTGGTLRGCSDVISELGLPTRLVAVDALGSVIFGGTPAARLIPGHGASLRTALVEGATVSDVVHVSDLDCVVGCRRLALAEGILAGGSSGGVLSAIGRIRDTIAAAAVVVAILPDRGERYLSSIYSDAWVARHFGDISALWSDSRHVPARPPATAER